MTVRVCSSVVLCSVRVKVAWAMMLLEPRSRDEFDGGFVGECDAVGHTPPNVQDSSQQKMGTMRTPRPFRPIEFIPIEVNITGLVTHLTSAIFSVTILIPTYTKPRILFS